jgi:hypothetical protein
MNTEEHNKTVKRELYYQLAIHIHYQIARDGLLATMLARGVTMDEITESDRSNAQLREDYGDTPYAAPDVDKTTGKCDGGDAWPVCCRGHRFEEHWYEIVSEGDRERGIWNRHNADGPNDPATLTVFDPETFRRETDAAFPGNLDGLSEEDRETFLKYGHDGPPIN